MREIFDQLVNRKDTDSVKWDLFPCELPMWVADMDFKAAPEILAAMQEKLDHGVFGYTIVPDEWYNAYIGWWRDNHGFEMKKEWMLFCEGVMPAVSSIVRKLTSPGDKIIIQSPVYNHFYISTEDNGRRVLDNPLIYEDGRYRMDLKDLEEKMKDPLVHLMILCNPHNPVGRIWDKEDLAEIGRLAKKYHITVLSDEIHCDVTRPGMGYTPFASVNETCRENSITCISPTKTFNLAGLKTSAVVIPDETLRRKVKRALELDEIGSPNTFSCPAAIAAFTKGKPWLDAVRSYIYDNRAYVEKYISENLPQLSVVKGDATYLLWIDLHALPGEGKDFVKFLRQEEGLFVSAGKDYGQAGESFLRMNIACPRAYVEDGMKRLSEGVKAYSRSR